MIVWAPVPKPRRAFAEQVLSNSSLFFVDGRITCLQADAAVGRHATVGWAPDGSLLAVPGPDGEVACLERLSWKEVEHFGGAHSGPVSLAAYSPNGEPGACCRPTAKLLPVHMACAALRVGSPRLKGDDLWMA